MTDYSQEETVLIETVEAVGAERMKTVDAELRDRLAEVEAAITDLGVEKDMIHARFAEASLEHRKLHRLVAVLDRWNAKTDGDD